MIVAHVPDPLLRHALRRAARPDEDVVWEPAPSAEALLRGFPRLVVRTDAEELPAAFRGAVGVPRLVVDRGMQQRWERVRARAAVPRTRVDFIAAALERRIWECASRSLWVDRTLADLSRLCGAPLPMPFRGMARRVMECPSRYPDLGAFEDLTGLSRGALKARFRRRDLDSLTHWIRYFRVVASAHVLSDRSVTTLQAAYRIGFSDSGNFCRLIQEVGGLTPTEAREPEGRVRLLAGAASSLGEPDARAAWESLKGIFLEGVA